MQRIYLDHNATTPLAPEALEAMMPYLSGEYLGAYGNPSSLHAFGRETRAALDDARIRIARLLGARWNEIVFTSGGTESDNLGVIGIARNRIRHGSERHVITSAIEHHAVLNAVNFLETNEGFRITRLPVDGSGRIDLDVLRREITFKTALVSIHSANNETGTLQPITEVGTICRKHGVPFHSDMVQAFGKTPVRVEGNENLSAISIAAHKFYGPRGAGALWLRSGVSIDAISFGGEQELGKRPGTENTAAIVGMAMAAELAANAIPLEHPRQSLLRDRLWKGILKVYPDAIRNGAWDDTPHQLCNTLNVSFPGLNNELLSLNCELEGLCVSSGSACMAGLAQPSHVLQAMGRARELAASSLRFSLGKGTTEEAIDAAIEILTSVIARLDKR